MSELASLDMELLRKQQGEKIARRRVCLHRIECKYTMKNTKGDELVYKLCRCGTVQHDDPIDKSKFNEEYLKKLRDTKFFEERIDYSRRTYMPIIEDATYGRESLDIGFGFEENIIDMRKRGWLADGIDLIPNQNTTGDFEAQEFEPNMFWDLVIMHHVLASFDDPIRALRKAISIVKPGGLLFLMAPDTSLILRTTYAEFGHWAKENRTMLSLQRTILECIRSGMEETPLVALSNQSKRFLYFNDYHLIMKKGLS